MPPKRRKKPQSIIKILTSISTQTSPIIPRQSSVVSRNSRVSLMDLDDKGTKTAIVRLERMAISYKKRPTQNYSTNLEEILNQKMQTKLEDKSSSSKIFSLLKLPLLDVTPIVKLTKLPNHHVTLHCDENENSITHLMSQTSVTQVNRKERSDTYSPRTQINYNSSLISGSRLPVIQIPNSYKTFLKPINNNEKANSTLLNILEDLEESQYPKRKTRRLTIGRETTAEVENNSPSISTFGKSVETTPKRKVKRKSICKRNAPKYGKPGPKCSKVLNPIVQEMRIPIMLEENDQEKSPLPTILEGSASQTNLQINLQNTPKAVFESEIIIGCNFKANELRIDSNKSTSDKVRNNDELMVDLPIIDVETNVNRTHTHIFDTGMCFDLSFIEETSPEEIDEQQEVRSELNIGRPAIVNAEPDYEGNQVIFLEEFLENLNEDHVNNFLISRNGEGKNQNKSNDRGNISEETFRGFGENYRERSRREENVREKRTKENIAFARNIRLGFGGYRTVITSKDADGSINIQEDNCEEKCHPTQEKYLKISTNTVHIHNHFYS